MITPCDREEMAARVEEAAAEVNRRVAALVNTIRLGVGHTCTAALELGESLDPLWEASHEALERFKAEGFGFRQVPLK